MRRVALHYNIHAKGGLGCAVARRAMLQSFW